MFTWLKLKLIHDRQSDGQSVLVSGAQQENTVTWRETPSTWSEPGVITRTSYQQQFSSVKACSNTSTIPLRVDEGDEKETQYLGA
jgi:hypothetical protein